MPFVPGTRSGGLLSSARGAALSWLVLACCIVLRYDAAAMDEHAKREQRLLKIVSANLSLDNKQPLKATQALIQESPDIVILLEWTGLNADARLLQTQGYTFIVNEPRRGTRGIALLAKAGLSAVGGLIEPPVRGPCAMPFGIMVFTLEGQDIALIGIHAPPPIEACEDTTRPTLQAIQTWIKDGRLAIDKKPATTGHRVILAGDFNARPSDKTMRRFVDRGLIDTSSKSNALYEPTWSPYESGPRLIRIDYVFVPKDFIVLGHRVIRLPGSDHAAVAAEIAISAMRPAK